MFFLFTKNMCWTFASTIFGLNPTKKRKFELKQSYLIVVIVVEHWDIALMRKLNVVNIVQTLKKKLMAKEIEKMHEVRWICTLSPLVLCVLYREQNIKNWALICLTCALRTLHKDELERRRQELNPQRIIIFSFPILFRYLQGKLISY